MTTHPGAALAALLLTLAACGGSAAAAVAPYTPLLDDDGRPAAVPVRCAGDAVAHQHASEAQLRAYVDMPNVRVVDARLGEARLDDPDPPTIKHIWFVRGATHAESVALADRLIVAGWETVFVVGACADR